MTKLPKSFGGHGATVVLFRRGKRLYLRWWNGLYWQKESLKHNDVDQGEQQARDKAAERLSTPKTSVTGTLTNKELRGYWQPSKPLTVQQALTVFDWLMYAADSVKVPPTVVDLR